MLSAHLPVQMNEQPACLEFGALGGAREELQAAPPQPRLEERTPHLCHPPEAASSNEREHPAPGGGRGGGATPVPGGGTARSRSEAQRKIIIVRSLFGRLPCWQQRAAGASSKLSEASNNLPVEVVCAEAAVTMQARRLPQRSACSGNLRDGETAEKGARCLVDVRRRGAGRVVPCSATVLVQWKGRHRD